VLALTVVWFSVLFMKWKYVSGSRSASELDALSCTCCWFT